MAKYVDIQTNFTSGEIDPLLRSRIDIKQYQNGASKLTNVFVQPQGGVKRRPGLRQLKEIPTEFSPEDGIKLIPFEFSVNDSYMLALSKEGIFIFRNKEHIQGNETKTVSGVTEFTTYNFYITPDKFDDLCFTQSADTIILTHEDMNPVTIKRTLDTHKGWSMGQISFDSVPKYAYNLYRANPTGTLTPDEISGTVTLTASVGNTHSGTATAGGTDSITLDALASSTDDEYNNLYIELTGGTGSGQIRIIRDYVGSTKVATVYEDWDTQPDATSTFEIKAFTTESVGQYINASPQGRLRIVEYVSSTSVKGKTEVPFFSTDAIDSGDWEIETGYENIWSADRGWPRTCTFHEGRLYFGGSKSRPTTIWGSKVGLFFDFEPVEGFDDDAVEATLDTNTLNIITDIISGRDLQVFTTGGEFYVPQTNQEPVTPTNFFVRAGTRNGSKPGVRVVQLDSGTMYIKRQGKSLSEFLYSDTTLSYVSNNISLLSSHLLKSPTAIALRKAISTDESDLLFVVNGDDGSMAAYSLLTQQQVVAPSEIITDGEFLDVAVDVTDTYVVTKRTFDGTDKYFIEVFDEDYFTDCAISEVPSEETNCQLVSISGTTGTITFFTGQSANSPDYGTAFEGQVDLLDDSYIGSYIEVTAAARTGVFQITAINKATSTITATVTEDLDSTTDLDYDDFVVKAEPYIDGTKSYLDHEGEALNVIADGNVLGNETVASNSITFDRSPTTSYEIGLPFSVEVTTQPVDKDIGTGTRIAFKKRIVEINSILNDTQHINLNGVLVPIRAFDTEGTLDNPTTSYTGIKTLYGVRGYSKDATVSVTQNYPLKMTLLGLEYKVSTSGGA